MENERRDLKEELSSDRVGRRRTRDDNPLDLDEAALLSRVPSLRIERNPAVSSRDPPLQTSATSRSVLADERPRGSSPEASSRLPRSGPTVSEIWLRTGGGEEIQFG